MGNHRILLICDKDQTRTSYGGAHTQCPRQTASEGLPSGIIKDPNIVARLLKKARTANLLRHPGVAQMFEFGHLSDGSAFVLMEFSDGEPLTERICRLGQLSEADALRLVHQIASTLSVTHEAGIVHCDLKPDNVIILSDLESPNGEWVKVTNWGITKASNAHTPDNSAILDIPLARGMGTPAYMSPEQCMNTADIDDRTDVYALGVMLFQMISGHLPFDEPGPMQLMHAHMTIPPPIHILETLQGVSRGLVELVSAMLRKVSAERPSMRDVLAEVERLSDSSLPMVPIVAPRQLPYAIPKRSESR